MKRYNKSFEDVYSGEYAKNLCKLGSVSTFGGLNTSTYIDLYSKFVSEALVVLWDISIKHHWLERQFVYGGKRRAKKSRNGIILDSVFSVFFRNIVGGEHKIFSRMHILSKIETYIDDFFPDFDFNNPFREPKKYLFPYKNIGLDHLLVVYQMPERLELLEEAEKKNMTYVQFLDYVINYVFSYNEDVGDDIYIFMRTTLFPPYVKYIHYHEYKKKQRKRGRKKNI